MIQRGIGAAIGALVTLLILIAFGPEGAAIEDFIPAVVIGAVVMFAWPIVIAWWLGRRAKARRESQIEDEVQRQLDQQG